MTSTAPFTRLSSSLMPNETAICWPTIELLLSAKTPCVPPRSPDLLDAHDGAVRDVTSFLLFTRDAHDDHMAVASRFRADADVGRSPVLVTDREQDLGVSRLERAASAHVPGCAVRGRAARFGPAGSFRMVHRLLVQVGWPKCVF